MSSGKRRDDVANSFVHMLLRTTGRTWTAPTAGPRRSCVSIIRSLSRERVSSCLLSRTTLSTIKRTEEDFDGGGCEVLVLGCIIFVHLALFIV